MGHSSYLTALGSVKSNCPFGFRLQMSICFWYGAGGLPLSEFGWSHCQRGEVDIVLVALLYVEEIDEVDGQSIWYDLTPPTTYISLLSIQVCFLPWNNNSSNMTLSIILVIREELPSTWLTDFTFLYCRCLLIPRCWRYHNALGALRYHCIEIK